MASRNPDLAALTRRFAAIHTKVRARVQPAVDKGADELVSRMKYLAPSEDGELVNSIVAEPGPVPLSRTVSAGGPQTTGADGFDHALGQEFGTVSMDRNSYFWPSVNSLRKRVRGRIDRAISKAVKEAWE